MPTTHHLKTVAAYWDAVSRGDKPFDVRKDDRAFQAGDTLVLERLAADRSQDHFQHSDYIALTRLITFVLHGGQFGIEPGYVVLGLAQVPEDNFNGDVNSGNNGDK